MKNTSLLFCFLACCGSLAGQEKGKPSGKKQNGQSAVESTGVEKARAKPAANAGPAVKSKPATPIKRVAPAIQWEGRIFPDAQQNRPVIRRVLAAPGQRVLMNWDNGWDSLDFGDGSKGFEKFVASEIAQMAKVCKLSAGQKRKLELAAKGVVHREKAKKTAAAEDQPEPAVPNLGARIIRFVPSPTTDDLRKRLNGTKLWTRTLAKLLSKEQQKAWKDRPSEKPKSVRPVLRPLRGARRLFQLNQAIEALNTNRDR